MDRETGSGVRAETRNVLTVRASLCEPGHQAWSQHGNGACVLGHKQCGLTTAIEGEDHLLTPEPVSWWASPRLDMPSVRRQLRSHIIAHAQCGAITSWAEASSLMEQHDPHKGRP